MAKKLTFALGTGVARRGGMLLHLTARAPLFLFRAPLLAVWVFARLRELFPLALAVCVMDNHIHVVVYAKDPDLAQRSFVGLLGSISRRIGKRRNLWEIAEPSKIADRQKLFSNVRYVHLNPCRALVVGDPLEWPWSTHRDVVGAIADPWVSAERLADALGMPRAGFARAFHRRVSDDSTVATGGTPFPEPAPITEFPSQPLERIVAAACAATRSPRAAIRHAGQARNLTLRLAWRNGWRQTSLLARLVGCSENTVRARAREDDPEGLRAAQLCLGDDRLLRWPL